MIDEHAARCEDCSHLLRFGSEMKRIVRDRAAAHPEVSQLVRYAEDPDAMDAQDRTGIALHVAACESCENELSILREIDEDVHPREAVMPAAPPVRGTVRVRLDWRLWWESIGRTMLRPAAAAAYLTVAVLAIATLLLRPVPPYAPTGSRVQGVILVPDASGAVRGYGEPGEGEPAMEHDRAASLLLELTDLEAPPGRDDLYRITVTSRSSGEPAWSGEVKGDAFAANYTLLLNLEAGTLPAGSYDVRIIDPGNRNVFRSGLLVR